MTDPRRPTRPPAGRFKTVAIACVLAVAPAAGFAATADLEGIWKGMLVAKVAEVEAEILFEIGRTPEGELTGTFDMPVQNYRFHPLDHIVVEGSKVTFDFRRDSETRGKNALFVFHGELSEDGRRITGEVVDGEARIPFYLVWTDPAGTPREEVRIPPVETMSPAGDELRAAFNRDKDHVRLVMMLSPT